MMARRFEVKDYAASRAVGSCPAFVGQIVAVIEDSARGAVVYHLRDAYGRRFERVLFDLSPAEGEPS